MRARPFSLAERASLAMDSAVTEFVIQPGVNNDLPREFIEKWARDKSVSLRRDPKYPDLFYLD